MDTSVSTNQEEPNGEWSGHSTAYQTGNKHEHSGLGVGLVGLVVHRPCRCEVRGHTHTFVCIPCILAQQVQSIQQELNSLRWITHKNLASYHSMKYKVEADTISVRVRVGVALSG